MEIRQDITILPADDMDHRVVGLQMFEKIGIGAYNPRGVTRLEVNRELTVFEGPGPLGFKMIMIMGTDGIIRCSVVLPVDGHARQLASLIFAYDGQTDIFAVNGEDLAGACASQAMSRRLAQLVERCTPTATTTPCDWRDLMDVAKRLWSVSTVMLV